MRKVVYQLLTNDSALIADIPADRWYERGSVVDAPKLPFATIVWGGATSRGVGRNIKGLELWVYDKPGDTTLINRVLLRTKTLLDAAEQVVVGGERLVQADFQSTSPDLPDDTYKATVRTISYQCIGTGV